MTMFHVSHPFADSERNETVSIHARTFLLQSLGIRRRNMPANDLKTLGPNVGGQVNRTLSDPEKDGARVSPPSGETRESWVCLHELSAFLHTDDNRIGTSLQALKKLKRLPCDISGRGPSKMRNAARFHDRRIFAVRREPEDCPTRARVASTPCAHAS